MKKIFLVAVLGATFALCAIAQSDAEYQDWMKTNAATVGNLNKSIAAKDGAAATADAQKLEGIFKEVQAFWEKRGGAEDAVSFSMKAQTAAANIAKAASAGNFEQAAADVKSLQANCGGCHMAHREGARGAFKIK